MPKTALKKNVGVKATIHSTEEEFIDQDYTQFLQKMRLLGIPFSFSGNKEK